VCAARRRERGASAGREMERGRSKERGVVVGVVSDAAGVILSDCWDGRLTEGK
jgi:hypothetical protein